MSQLSRKDARLCVMDWVSIERSRYADRKYADDEPNRERLIASMEADGFSQEWLDFTLQYLKRAQLFGPDTLQGRQAMGKALVTVMHTLETAVQLFGSMPKPGVSSTDGAEPWDLWEGVE